VSEEKVHSLLGRRGVDHRSNACGYEIVVQTLGAGWVVTTHPGDAGGLSADKSNTSGFLLLKEVVDLLRCMPEAPVRSFFPGVPSTGDLPFDGNDAATSSEPGARFLKKVRFVEILAANIRIVWYIIGSRDGFWQGSSSRDTEGGNFAYPW
jgi:hypothetical protein